jgi:hypothetical protein
MYDNFQSKTPKKMLKFLKNIINEIAHKKYGDKGKKGVILISTKKINKLH